MVDLRYDDDTGPDQHRSQRAVTRGNGSKVHRAAKLASEVVAGDIVEITLSEAFTREVALVRPTGSKKWMTEVPILRIEFVDPRGIKALEVAADQHVTAVTR